MESNSFDIQWITQRIRSNLKGPTHLILHSTTPQQGILTNGETTNENFLLDSQVNVPTHGRIDKMAAEDLIFMAQDGQVSEIADVADVADVDEHNAIVMRNNDISASIDCESVMQQIRQMSNESVINTQVNEYSAHYIDNTPQMVTEEVITDDWVQDQGEDRVEVSAEQIIGSGSQGMVDVEVPLPTVQDEYTALRPYPCDFCSRRFRKKVSLTNHMGTHKNDRPHLCKLCGSRFFRRTDLINHLKAHADALEPEYNDVEYMNFMDHDQHRQRYNNDHFYQDQEQDQDWNECSDQNSIYEAEQQKKSTNAKDTRRGRTSRLKLKEENYTIDESLRQSPEQNVALQDMVYDHSPELQPSTASVKLINDEETGSPSKSYPILDESKPFVCQQCGLAFAREKALKSHIKNHSNSDSQYECNYCNELFWDIASMQEHIKQHRFEESNSDFDPEDLDDSQTDSGSEQLFGEYYCHECGMSFHRQDLLRRHSKIHTKPNSNISDNNKNHSCNTCGENFAEALDLLAHAEIHARYPPFKCVLCGESFFEESTIKRHLYSSHPNVLTPNTCVLCGKECRDRKALMKHSWDHSREKCHSCSKCGKNFHNKARLKRHMASHRDKSVTCDVCHEEFPDGRLLSNHRHSHSTTSAGKMFPCNECGKTFGSRSSQQIHVRIHTGERPYGCRFCWKAFADGGTLRKHERIHTGEKPYACSVCPRAFNQRVVLREHIRSHHSGLDSKRGTYHCSVCSSDLPSSNDLMQHLIKHSDMNTAMQRQPVTGPRKYKRRRKLKPHEIARMRSAKQENNSDVDMSDFDIDNIDAIELKKPIKRRGTTEYNKRGNKATTTRRKVVSNPIENIKNDDSKGIRKTRNNSVGMNTERLLENKLLNTNDQYRSILSNMENTLQSIDTLVVSKTTVAEDETCSDSHSEDSSEGTAQRTKQVQIGKNNSRRLQSSTSVDTTPASSKARRKSNRVAQIDHPRMIHTQKVKPNIEVGINKKRKKRPKSYISRNSTNKESINMVEDYDIISPDPLPPQQISCSPLYIKQELHSLQNTPQILNTSTRSSDFYDAQLLLEASTLRKEVYEKFNPSIVNDLEEILRSPFKSDKSNRQRFTSESSANFIVEPPEVEQCLIKIEPTSPDLHEIVTGSSSRNSNTTNHITPTTKYGERRSTRLSCNRASNVNRKYLEFDVTNTSGKRNSSTRGQSKRSMKSSTKRIPSIKTSSNNASFGMDYGDNEYRKSSNGNETLTVEAAAASVSSTFSAISDAVSAADAAAKTTASIVPGLVGDRKPKRYFECEMCSAVFTDRAQLLDHVPMHI